MIELLTIECSEVACTSTVSNGQYPSHIIMTLIDVRVEELMNSLIKKAGVQAILDNISDADIENYLKGSK